MSDEHDISHLDVSGNIEMGQQSNWGGYSDIWTGILRVETRKIEVAIKVLRVRHSTISVSMRPIEERLSKRFFREVLLWRALQHPNIVPLLGFTMNPDGLPTLISPWYSNGNVLQYITMHPKPNRLSLALDIAKGLSYLHAIAVAHGDLKGENVLVDVEGHASICDFGMSQFIDDATRITGFTTTTANAGGTERFLCPELLDDQPKTMASDMWAFGCLIAQIFTGRVPYSHIASKYVVPVAILRGDPPMTNNDGLIDAQMWKHITKCWNMNPNDRPVALDLESELEGNLKMVFGITALKQLAPSQVIKVPVGGRVTSFKFSPDGKYLAASLLQEVSRERVVAIWQVEGGVVTPHQTYPCSVETIAWSSQGDRLLVRCATHVEIWSAGDFKMIAKYSGTNVFGDLNKKAIWLPRGDAIAYITKHEISIQYLTQFTPIVYHAPMPISIRSAAFTPDSERLVLVGTNNRSAFRTAIHQFIVYNLDNKEVESLRSLRISPLAITMGFDGQHVLVSYVASPPELWKATAAGDNESKRLKFKLLHSYNQVKSVDVWNRVRFGGVRDRFVIGLSCYREIHFWDRETAMHLYSFPVSNNVPGWSRQSIGVAWNYAYTQAFMFASISSENAITIWSQSSKQHISGEQSDSSGSTTSLERREHSN